MSLNAPTSQPLRNLEQLLHGTPRHHIGILIAPHKGMKPNWSASYLKCPTCWARSSVCRSRSWLCNSQTRWEHNSEKRHMRLRWDESSQGCCVHCGIQFSSESTCRVNEAISKLWIHYPQQLKSFCWKGYFVCLLLCVTGIFLLSILYMPFNSMSHWTYN